MARPAPCPMPHAPCPVSLIYDAKFEQDPSMREIVITRHGAPDVMEERERPTPEPGPGEVRLRVKAAGVNFADILARMGLYPDAPAPPLVAGTRCPATSMPSGQVQRGTRWDATCWRSRASAAMPTT